MARATHLVAKTLGTYAGLLAAVHGVFQALQGDVEPQGVLIHAIGAPCRPEAVWHACLPAMTLVPSLLLSGALAVLLGLCIVICSLTLAHRRRNGLVLIPLALSLLAVGGGFVPCFVGIVAGVAGGVHPAPRASRRHPLSRMRRLLARAWPWPLILFIGWAVGGWALGHVFNRTFTEAAGLLFILFDVALPVLTLLSAAAHDLARTLPSA